MRKFLFYTILAMLFSAPLTAQSGGDWKTGDFFIYINTDKSVAAGLTNTIISDVDYYISDGVSIDAQDADGNTALHLAILKSNPHLILALIQFNPDSNITNNDGKTPLDLAKEGLAKNKDNEFWQETVELLEKYQRVVSIKYAVTFLRKGDATNVLDERIYNINKFIKSMSSIDDVIATNYLYETSMEMLSMQIIVTDKSLLAAVDKIDATWKEKVNSLITPELDKIEAELKSPSNQRAFIKAEQRLTEINNATYKNMSKENTDKFISLYSLCTLKLYDMTNELGKSDLEKRLKLLLMTKATGDALIESALVQLLEISVTMGNSKLLVFITVLGLISCDDYKGTYKNIEFIKTLSTINDLFKINNYEPLSVDKLKLEELTNQAKRQKFVLDNMSLRLN
jgi:hypothetical protein